MRYTLIGGLCASLLLTSAAVMAEEKKTDDKTTEASKEKSVCRSQPQLGSILRKRVCHTAAEWEQIRIQSEASAQRALENSGTKAMGTPGQSL